MASEKGASVRNNATREAERAVDVVQYKIRKRAYSERLPYSDIEGILSELIDNNKDCVARLISPRVDRGRQTGYKIDSDILPKAFRDRERCEFAVRAVRPRFGTRAGYAVSDIGSNILANGVLEVMPANSFLYAVGYLGLLRVT